MKRTEAMERRFAIDLLHHPPFEVYSQNSVDLPSSTECKTYARRSVSSLTAKEKPVCSDDDRGDCGNSTTVPTTRHHRLASSPQLVDDDKKTKEEMLTMALLHNKHQHNKQQRKVSIDSSPLTTIEDAVPKEDEGNSITLSENDLTSTREDFLKKFREIQQSRFIFETSTVPKTRSAVGWLKGLSTRSILSPKPSQRKLDVFPDDGKGSSKEEERPTFSREGLLKRRVSDLSIEQLSQRFRRSSMELISRISSSGNLLEAEHIDDSFNRITEINLSQKKIERAIPTKGLVHQVSNRMFNYQGSKSFESDEDEDDDYDHTESQNFLFSKMQQVEANNLMSLIRRDE